jgi:hypothetical protein
VRHRLGRFEPKPGSSVYDSFDLHPRLAPLLSRALQEMLRVEVSPERPQRAGVTPATRRPGAGAGPGLLDPANGLRPFQGLSLPPGPDLLKVLKPGHPDRVWVVGLKDQLEELTRRLEIRLLDCEYEPGPDGFLAITGISPSIAAEVREHDPVLAGFVALRDRDRPLEIAERVFRVVSTTGAILVPHEAEVARLSVEERVERCIDRDRFMSVAARLRAAAGQELAAHATLPAGMAEVEDRGPGETSWERGGDDPRELVPEPYRDRVEAALREAGDPSLHGLLNAVTSVARDLPDFRERLELEKVGGALARRTPAPGPLRPEAARAPALV